MTDFAKAWHDTERRYLLGRSPQELIEEEQVAKTPDALALAMGAERLSYRDLNEKANHRAHFLQDRGTGAERLVGVYLDRSIEMVVAFLAIRKAGGACLPLDTEVSEGTAAFMLADAEVPVLQATNWAQSDNRAPSASSLRAA